MHFNYFNVREIKNIVVIHDLTPLIVDDYLFKHQIPKADTIIAVSINTKNDLKKKFNFNKVKVCYPGDPLVNNGFYSKIKSQYLYVGDSRPHKNLNKMIQIWEQICLDGVDRQLIMIGSLNEFKCNVKNIQILVNVSDAKLDRLYWESDGLFFLSENEGFRLPIIEASNRNSKCIIYNKSSLKEIAKDVNTYRIDNLDKIDYKELGNLMSTHLEYDSVIYNDYSLG